MVTVVVVRGSWFVVDHKTRCGRAVVNDHIRVAALTTTITTRMTTTANGVTESPLLYLTSLLLSAINSGEQYLPLAVFAVHYFESVAALVAAQN